jgi:DNA-binding PucR family transcriptional regulator
MVFHADELDSAVAAIHRRLRAIGQAPILVCATAIPATNESMRRSFLRALRSAKILRAVGVTNKAISTARLGLYTVLFDPDRGDDLVLFLADTVGSLVEYDKRRGTDLVGTLAAYFDNSFNLTRTSKVLHVHMNTLVKRMERIESILGQGWQGPEHSLTLQLAVRLHTIANAVDPVA